MSAPNIPLPSPLTFGPANALKNGLEDVLNEGEEENAAETHFRNVSAYNLGKEGLLMPKKVAFYQNSLWFATF